MKYNSNTLLESLQADVRQVLLEAEQLKQHPFLLLQKQPTPGSWSVAQVLEHLNIYARYYIGAIEQRIHLNKSAAQTDFNPGWLGNYFTRLMKPQEGNTISKKMKAPKTALPSSQPSAQQMLDEFIRHQHNLLNLLEIAKTVNLGYVRIPTSLSKFITLKLGDTFRFFIAHEQRHFVQIHNILKVLNPASAFIHTSENNYCTS
jgi:uncharacterized damage-inducible protein DinB